MRRMMHATLLLLFTASIAQAQSEVRPDYGGRIAAKSFATVFTPDCSDRPYSQLATYMNCNDCCPNLWDNYSSERAALAAHCSRHIDGRCSCFAHNNCSHCQASAPCGGHGCHADGQVEIGVPVNRYVSSGHCNQANGPACKHGCNHKLTAECLTFSSLYKTPSPNCAAAVVAPCHKKAPCGPMAGYETASNANGSKLGTDKSLLTFSSLYVSPK